MASGFDVVEDAIPVVHLPVSMRLPERPGQVSLVSRERDLECWKRPNDTVPAKKQWKYL
jgi:hypothetical protein